MEDRMMQWVVIFAICALLIFLLGFVWTKIRKYFKWQTKQDQPTFDVDVANDPIIKIHSEDKPTPLEKTYVIYELSDSVEAEMLKNILAGNDIHCTIQSFHDYAVDGMWQSLKGWGFIRVLEKDRFKAGELIKEFLASNTRPQPGTQPTSRLARLCLTFAIISYAMSYLAIYSGQLIDYYTFTTEWEPKLIRILLASIAIALPLISIIMGIVILARFKKGVSTEKDKGLAISGIIISAVPIVGLLIAVAIYFLFIRPRLFPAPTNEKFNPQTYQGDKGAIILPYKGPSVLTVWSPDKNAEIELSSSDGTILAPAGNLRIKAYEINARDINGAEWKLFSYFISPFDLTVKANSSQNINIGSPFTTTVNAIQKDGYIVSFEFILKDCAGNQYGIEPFRPEFQVMAKTGEILWKDKLAGENYLWRKPDNIMGEVLVRPVLYNNPFDIIYADTQWLVK